MSTGYLKKPSRPPPPPPIEYPPSVNHRKSNSRSDYIKISECHTGLPERLPKPIGFKTRASTSFSSTLKPSSSNYAHSSHQKSRSLTENHLGSSYLYLDLPSSLDSRNNPSTPPSMGYKTEYKTLDHSKTKALNECIKQLEWNRLQSNK